MHKQAFYLSLILPALACAEPVMPDAIKAPQGHEVFLATHAKGSQIYQCTFASGEYNWQFQTPEAKLFDQHGQVIGRHYQGPTWVLRTGGLVRAKVAGKTEAKNAIAWLLLKVSDHQGNSPFTKTSFIQRINTEGGLPPEKPCDGNHLGQEIGTAYSADYWFYKPL
jgi:hypothetical protein